MKCMMLHPCDGEWAPYPSIAAARDQFWSDADDAINRWGQSEDRWSSAWVVLGHFDEPGGDEYPDRIFHYGAERDSVRIERV